MSSRLSLFIPKNKNKDNNSNNMEHLNLTILTINLK